MSGAGWALAIDFGTSFTTAAMADDGGPPVVVEVENSRYFPSVVVVDPDGQVLTGRAAVAQAGVYPERAVRVPKRELVKAPWAVLPSGPVAVADLVASVLRRMYAEALLRHGGQPPARVVLTHPARWDAMALGRLREAAAKAGIASPELLPEPVAAARRFAAPGGDGRPIGVFDLGGGTLDTAVLRPAEGGFSIAGPPGGDADLGGEDFDELLFGRVSDMARKRDEAAWRAVFSGAGLGSRRDLALLRADVRAAKEALSEHLTYEIAVPGFAEAFRVTRQEFTGLIHGKLDDAVAEMRQTISGAQAQPAELAGVYLSGGSCRIPLVAERLANGLGVQPQLRDDPKAVVALGALTPVAVTQPTITAPAMAPPTIAAPTITAPTVTPPATPFQQPAWAVPNAAGTTAGAYAGGIVPPPYGAGPYAGQGPQGVPVGYPSAGSSYAGYAPRPVPGLAWQRGYLQGGPVGFGTAVGQAFTNMFMYRGRASRSAYWWFYLLHAIVNIIIAALTRSTAAPLVLDVLALPVTLPLGVRRLHDSGHSGYWCYLLLLPIVGWIALAVFFCLPPTPGPNRFDLPPAAAQGRPS